MIFVSGETRCVKCGQLLDATDDVFVVTPEAQPREVPGPTVGFYHYNCFGTLPARHEYLEREGALLREEIQDPNAPWAVVAATEDYALTQFAVDRTLRLTFFRTAREFRFPTLRAWIAFRFFVLGLAPRQARETLTDRDHPESGVLFQVKKSPQGIELLAWEPVDKEIEFTEAAMRKMFPALPRAGDSVDFEQRSRNAGVQPMSVDELLRGCKGTIIEIAANGDKVRVQLRAARWIKVLLSPAELRSFRAFLSSAP